MVLLVVIQAITVAVELEEVLVDDAITVVVLGVEYLRLEGSTVEIVVSAVLEPVPAVTVCIGIRKQWIGSQ